MAVFDNKAFELDEEQKRTSKSEKDEANNHIPNGVPIPLDQTPMR